jgi:hypothetical protein
MISGLPEMKSPASQWPNLPHPFWCSSSDSSPRQSLQEKKADLDPPSLHRKIPFLPRISETGSMTGWWVASLCPTTSTTQSSGSNSGQHSCVCCARMGAFRTPARLWIGLCKVITRPLRVRLCIRNFRSRLGAETGSMTGWWVTSSSPITSTTQS